MTGMAEDYVESRGGSKLLADIPLGRVATAAETAEAVRWLAVDAPASATGAVIDVNAASFVRSLEGHAPLHQGGSRGGGGGHLAARSTGGDHGDEDGGAGARP